METTKVNFSASVLVKKSAAQIKYLRDNPTYEVSENALIGEQFQHAIAKELNADEEMSTRLELDEIVLYASHDIVTDKYVQEIKSVFGEAPQWYLESSILQTAFYKSMIMLSTGKMLTSAFRVAQGYESKSIEVSTDIEYRLKFGEDVYVVEVSNPKAIVDYFAQKAKSTFDYDTAREYDRMHKFKHFQECSKYFKYNRLS